MKAKIGMLVPSVNFNAEPDYHMMAPEGVIICTNRVREDINKWAARMKITSKEFLKKMDEVVKNIEKAAEVILDANVDMVTYSCTTGSFVLGSDWHKKIVEKLERITNLPATTTSTAAVEAFKKLGVNKISVAAPYRSQINETLRRLFEGNGFRVANLAAFERHSATEIGTFTPDEIYKLASKAFVPSAEGIFISCTNFRGAGVVDRLERDLGVPVVTATQGTMWHCLSKLKIADPIEGYGRLLKDPTLRKI